MVLGWKIAYEKKLPREGLSNWEVFAIATQACEQLNWDYLVVDENTFTATTPTHWTLSEEIIHLTISGDEIVLKSQSESFDLYEAGRNQRNIEQEFVPAFRTARHRLQGEQLQQLAAQLKEETSQQITTGSRVATERITFGWRDHEMTFILMLANVAMFVLMAFKGVNVFDPTPQDITTWGGNVREFVKAGEWWRLVTNLFVHIGILPLLANLFGLYFIGLMVETILGKLKYLLAYLISGALASLASIYFAGFGVTAGASGAIAGLYGVLIAFATTKYITKKFNWIWLAGIAAYAALNIWLGLHELVDTVANFAGLITGLIIGYLFYWFHFRRNLARAGGTRISIEIILLAIIPIYLFIKTGNKNDTLRFEMDMMKLHQIDLKAQTQLSRLDMYEDAARIIKDSTIPEWKHYQKELEKTKRYTLDKEYNKKRMLLQEYAQLRLKQTQLIYKSVQEETTKYDRQIDAVSDRIQEILDELGKDSEVNNEQ